jgi:hypothetical protein
MSDRFKSGSIIDYPYLWRWQSEAGREHGEKDRPVCLALAMPDTKQNITHLVILAISATPPFEGQRVIEIPPLELRRAGLSLLRRGWITVGEFNYDTLERSFYLDSMQAQRGSFGPTFLEEIRQALRPLLASKMGRIDRTR